MVDALVLGTSAVRRGGSSPLIRTIYAEPVLRVKGGHDIRPLRFAPPARTRSRRRRFFLASLRERHNQEKLLQVVEKSGQSLSRSFVVTVPAAELGVLLDARIAEVGPTLNLKGFRPGKVPAGHVRRVYGKALMSEVVEKTVGESSQKVLTDHNLRVAMQPDLRPVSDMEGVIAGREDLVYDLDVDVMPEFEPMDVSTLTLTRLVYVPSDEELAAALADLAGQNKTYKTRGGKSPKAKDGDQVLMDFVGTVDGVPFDGGASLDAEIVLGSGRFIPGFEAQLVGASPGAEVTVNVIFPEDYTAENLRSKAAVFAVTVKEVREPKEAKVDDALAVQLGMADLLR